MGAMVSGELEEGEFVQLRFSLSSSSHVLELRARVCHQRGRCRSRAVVTHSRTAVQASRSSGVVLPMCVAPMTTVVVCTGSSSGTDTRLASAA